LLGEIEQQISEWSRMPLFKSAIEEKKKLLLFLLVNTRICREKLAQTISPPAE
jgi:hypothetical protein